MQIYLVRYGITWTLRIYAEEYSPFREVGQYFLVTPGYTQSSRNLEHMVEYTRATEYLRSTVEISHVDS